LPALLNSGVLRTEGHDQGGLGFLVKQTGQPGRVRSNTALTFSSWSRADERI
jgi:hypothetical protein